MLVGRTVLCLVVMETLRQVTTFPATGEATERKIHKEDFTRLNRNVCPPSLCRDQAGQTQTASKVKNRSIFYQGDIVLGHKLKHRMFSSRGSSRSRRAAARDNSILWKDGVVIYWMDEEINSRSRAALVEAMSHISNNTCITFRERTSLDQHHVIFQSEPGCWAGIGVSEEYPQLVNLGEDCDTVGIAIHEIMHALGFWHEQARPDRDAYVRVIHENIPVENLQDFDTMSDSVIDSMQHPYDYLSIMHYDEYAFTENGEPTIQIIGAGAKLGLTVGQRSRLSSTDVSQIRELYHCNEKCAMLEYPDGRDYRGQKDYTQEGHTCQRWTDNYPRSHKMAAYSRGWVASRTGQSPDGLGDHNHCRNPDLLRRQRPWCYTTKTSPEWGYCDINICNKGAAATGPGDPTAPIARPPVKHQKTPNPPPTTTTPTSDSDFPPPHPVAVSTKQMPPTPESPVATAAHINGGPINNINDGVAIGQQSGQILPQQSANNPYGVFPDRHNHNPYRYGHGNNPHGNNIHYGNGNNPHGNNIHYGNRFSRNNPYGNNFHGHNKRHGKNHQGFNNFHGNNPQEYNHPVRNNPLREHPMRKKCGRNSRRC